MFPSLSFMSSLLPQKKITSLKRTSFTYTHRVGGNNKIALVIFSLFGFFTVDMIYMFSIMNYVAQGEMNIYLLWDVRRLIQTKSYKSIDAAIKVRGGVKWSNWVRG